MTNFEYWKDRILEIVKRGEGLALENGNLIGCPYTICENCNFYSQTNLCNVKRFEWLYSEHEKKPELTRQERKLCEALGTGWIAADEDGTVYWYESLPMKGEHSYRNRGNVMCVSNAGFHFAFMDFEDKEPWMVENLLQLEVEE